MASNEFHIAPGIRLSLSYDTFYRTETLLDHHLLVWIIAGQTEVWQANSVLTFDAGNIFILARNQVARLANHTVNGIQYKALTVQLPLERLRKLYHPLNVTPSLLPMDPSPLLVKNQASLENIFRYMIGVYERREQLSENAAASWFSELLSILRAIAPQVDNILGSFDVPGKQDLTRYMEGHFMFNLTIEEFSYLTGRSISAFNRDFRKAFGIPPQQWLTKKRLVLAHQQLTLFSKKPIDVYREVGFENLSHFSFAFKKHYGYPPKSASQHEND